MPRSTSRLTLRTRNTAAVVTNIRAVDQRLRRAAQRIVRKYGDLTLARAQQLCPVDTGFMVQHLTLWFTEGAYVYEVGWAEGDFAQAGLPFYPIYQEFGTSRMPAQPCLFPANAEMRPRFAAELSAALREAAERVA